MPAYLLVIRRRVLDADRYTQYLAAAAETLRESGATILASGAGESWEGPGVDGAVVVEFRDHAHAQGWFTGERYARARALRDGAAELELVLLTSAPAQAPTPDVVGSR